MTTKANIITGNSHTHWTMQIDREVLRRHKETGQWPTLLDMVQWCNQTSSEYIERWNVTQDTIAALVRESLDICGAGQDYIEETMVTCPDCGSALVGKDHVIIDKTHPPKCHRCWKKEQSQQAQEKTSE